MGEILGGWELRLYMASAVWFSCKHIPDTREPAFHEWLVESRLVAMETVAGGALQELVYTVVLKPKAAPQAFLEAVRKATDNNKVALVMGQQEVDL